MKGYDVEWKVAERKMNAWTCEFLKFGIPYLFTSGNHSHSPQNKMSSDMGSLPDPKTSKVWTRTEKAKYSKNRLVVNNVLCQAV